LNVTSATLDAGGSVRHHGAAMPIVKIDTRVGLSLAQKQGLFAAVHDALVACFKIPDHDRTQRLVEHAPENFEIPAGRGERYTVIELSVFAGRSIDAKRALYRDLVARIEKVGIPAADVFILLHEEPTENWGLRGGVAGCDIDFGFPVKA
jgi:phenylpyruvate tautomerase PptA (4-oxalocrotonate tautomerase family)